MNENEFRIRIRKWEETGKPDYEILARFYNFFVIVPCGRPRCKKRIRATPAALAMKFNLPLTEALRFVSEGDLFLFCSRHIAKEDSRNAV
jgi:hypothetical protein